MVTPVIPIPPVSTPPVYPAFRWGSTPAFEDALNVQVGDDGRNWKVCQAFHYDTDVVLDGWKQHLGGAISYLSAIGHCTQIVVPAGFITDFASIPQVFWNILPPVGRYGRAAVVHDLLYRTPGLATRGQADAVLMEAMTFLKVGWLARHIIYAGVRAGGHWSYHGGL